MSIGRLPIVPADDEPRRILGVTVIDGTGADPIDDGEVEIGGGRIRYVGTRRHRDIAGVRRLDAGGRYLLPGFVDTHIHACMPVGTDERTLREWFPEEEAFSTASTLRTTLAAGVTTARDLSGLTPGFRRAIARGQIAGPRLHLAVAMLSPTGGHADPLAPNGSLPVYAQRAITPGWAVVDTVEDIVRTVRRLDRVGADVIKVCSTGGMSSRHDSPTELGVPAEHIALIVDEMARRHGQPVTAHAQSAAGIEEAVRGGVSSVEHGYGLTDELIELMLERGTALVPTLAAAHRVPPGADHEERARRATLRAQADRMVGRAAAAGVAVATGTDAGIVAHGANLDEVRLLVGAGLSPMAAITAGTLTAAKLMRLDHEIGSVTAGKLADLVLSDVDPLAHPEALTTSISWVCQAGRVAADSALVS